MRQDSRGFQLYVRILSECTVTLEEIKYFMNLIKSNLGYTMYTPNKAQMNSKVQAWGNSLGLRIPKHIAEKMNFKAGVSVNIEVEKNKIIITPENDESLDEMIAKINKNNMHENIFDFDPVGKEVW